MLKNVIVVIVCFSLCSCKMMAKSKYQMGRKFDFKTKKEYIDFLSKKNLFDTARVYFMDERSYVNFVNERMQGDSSLVYQGMYFNDSMRIRRGKMLNDNQSCWGRIQNEIQHNLDLVDYPDSIIEIGHRLSGYGIYRVSDTDKFSMDQSARKLKIFLVYCYQFGTYYDRLYKDLSAMGKKYATKADIYIISIDPVCYLN